MAFKKTTRLNIGLIGFLWLLLTFKPAVCWGQAEIHPDHYEITNNGFGGTVKTAAGTSKNVSTFQGGAERIPSPQSAASTVILWNNAAIEAARDNNYDSLVIVRALAMMHTAMFDAWAHYEASARPTLGTVVRSPENDRTADNKREAVSYAAYRVLADLFPLSSAKLARLMMTLGCDPKFELQESKKPAGIGIHAAAQLLEYRHHDGANQLGDQHPGPYSDYTGYGTANTPDIIRDPDHWQPLKEVQNGKSAAQDFYMPQWGLVKPFGFDSTLDVRPIASPKTLRSDPAGYILQAKDLVEISNHLTERQKVIAEYWELSQGRGTNVILWNQFAQFVSRRDHYRLDDDVKLLFVLNNAMFDASIAAWDAKRYWDSERPQTAIATLARIFHGYMFHDDWQPYLPTPPFPDFVSSHSTVSAAAAEVLKRFTGSDDFGNSYVRLTGVSGSPGRLGATHDVVLSWATFTEAADESGMSRRYGGIHFEDADIEGRMLGRRVAALSWNKAQTFISGTETEATTRSRVLTEKETDTAGW